MNEINPVAFLVFGLPVYWYGIMVAGGLLLGFLVTMRRTRHYDIDPDTLVTFLLWAVPAALIGTRAAYVVSHWPDFRGDLISILHFREGGLAIHGGIITAVLVAVIFAAVNRLDFWRLADLCAPGLILGQAVGRWGNYFNQEAFGVETTLPWAMYIAGAWRHPTFLYESLWNFAVFFYLLHMSGRDRTGGGIFLRYLIWYSAGRFWIEGLRTDSAMIGHFRLAQVISLILIHGGLIALWLRRRRQPDRLPGRFSL